MWLTAYSYFKYIVSQLQSMYRVDSRYKSSFWKKYISIIYLSSFCWSSWNYIIVTVTPNNIFSADDQSHFWYAHRNSLEFFDKSKEVAKDACWHCPFRRCAHDVFYEALQCTKQNAILLITSTLNDTVCLNQQRCLIYTDNYFKPWSAKHLLLAS